jgi:endo-1,4-beta-xylanase
MPAPSDATKLQTPADMYRVVLQATLATPSCRTFVMWGFTDKYSWVHGTFPGAAVICRYKGKDIFS